MAEKREKVPGSLNMETKDEQTRRKIMEIIHHQFDLEIYLKHREVAMIQEEIENAEYALQDLALAIKNEKLAANLPELPHFTRQSAAFYHPSSSTSAASTPTTQPPSSAGNKKKSVLYGRRVDGAYVKLGCPVCHRTNFSAQLGLLNHCRISHSLEFGYYENIMAQCGTPVDESEIPEDHPIRTRPLALPIIPAATPPKKVERPTIKEYEEDVDLELDHDRTKKRLKIEDDIPPRLPITTAESVDQQNMPSESTSPHPIDSTSSSVLQTPIASPSSAIHPSVPERIASEPANTPTEGTTLSSLSSPISSSPSSSLAIVASENLTSTLSDTNNSTLAPKSEPQDGDAMTLPAHPSSSPPSSTTTFASTPRASPPAQAAQTAPVIEKEGPAITANTGTPLTPVSTIQTPDESETQPPAESKMESLTSAIEEKGSRFYIKRRLLVGNVSKYIPPEKRDPTLKNYTHKWMVYVVEPPQDKDKVRFLTAVRYHLHPSYKPYDVVDVTESPFRLTRLGWGEFPIRLQLYFVDKRRNKSLDVIHHLKLDYTLSGRQMLGSERGFDIELDRNTNFDDMTSLPSSSSLDTPSSPITTTATITTTTASTTTTTTAVTAPVPTPSTPSTSTLAASVMMTPATTNLTAADDTSEQKLNVKFNAAKQRLTLLQGILKEGVQLFPMIVRAGSQPSSVPYACATSNTSYFNMTTARRKALQWHRAHLLRLETQRRCQATKDEILEVAANALTTKDVLLWCRDQAYTPKLPEKDAEQKEVEKEETVSEATDVSRQDRPDYCRYCGSQDHVTAICKRKPTGWRKRQVLGDQHTLTDVQDLFEQDDLVSNPLEDGMLAKVKEEEEDEEEIVDIDVQQSPPVWSTTLRRHEQTIQVDTDERKRQLQLVQLIRSSTHSDSPILASDERALDWVWSVIAQLRLKSMIGSELFLSRQGLLQLQPRASEVTFDAAIDQRLVVGQLFLQITKVFVKRLLRSSVAIWETENQEDQLDKRSKLLVPYHIYQAVKQHTHFDFLTNAYMGTSTTDGDKEKSLQSTFTNESSMK